MRHHSIIIGGTTGIGYRTAHYLTEQGYKVIVGGRSQKNLCDSFEYRPIDVTDEESVQEFFSSLEDRAVDSLIYAVGTTTGKKSIEAFCADEYQRVHEVNVVGALRVCKYCFPLLKKAQGKVVIISSIAARAYSKFSGFEYTMSKSALSGFVKQISIEWAADNVLINTLFPSMVDTPMLRNNVEPLMLKAIEEEIPLGRIAQAQEIAAGIEFLISERNSYITGAGLDVNGGQFLTG